MDYYEIAESVAQTLAKAGAALNDDQRILLAGALAPWLDKVRLMEHVEMERQAHESQKA